MRLQHLALFRGIGLGACAVILVPHAPCAGPVVASSFDHHRVTVEVALDFPLRFPNVALRQNRFLAFVNFRKSGNP